MRIGSASASTTGRAAIDENCSVALHVNAGHAHDGRQFETLYERLDPDNVLEAAVLDKGYDADRIRERLSYDGIQPVIPPISTRSKKLPYNKELYRTRNGPILRRESVPKTPTTAQHPKERSSSKSTNLPKLT